MANDRLYIQCMECGELLFVAKRGLGEWYVWDVEYEDRLNDFFIEHYLKCGNNTSRYRFVSEFDETFPESPKFFERPA